MLSETLTEGLQRYEIGAKLRALRLKKKMGLAQLSARTGLSSALLSKIERGRMFPTLPTLLRMAQAVGVGLEYFFADARDRAVLAISRRPDRIRLPERPDDRHSSYSFESLDYAAADRKLNGYYVEFDPTPPALPKVHAHEGAELIYLLRGRLIVTVDDVDHKLAEGDSMYFDSTRSHSYRRDGPGACAAIVVTTG